MTLFELLPNVVYRGEEHVRLLQEALEAQVVKIEAVRDDIKRQCLPETSTWGMARYERAWGLPVDTAKPMEQRLAAYRSKRRQLGTTTAEVIKSIAEGFYNGEVAVVEHKREFWAEVVFLSLIGVPPNLDDLKAAIAEVRPAHMELVYVVVYNTHTVLQQMTNDQMAAYTNDQLRAVRLHPNTHNDLRAGTHTALSARTQQEIMMEEIDHVGTNSPSQAGTARRG